MRQISKLSSLALRQMTSYNGGNTIVSVEGDRTKMHLFGNLIATYDDHANILILRDAGYRTNTTKERLNTILDVFNTWLRIFQKDGAWYVENIKDGSVEEWYGLMDIGVEPMDC